MKINLPVTDKEILMQKGEILLSRTDLKGRITYVNDAFVKISGFTRDELIGANHNIVRHPDMPASAYEDLWNNLKQGRPWTAPVKNRAKSGDFYWVEANVVPIFENGQAKEYLSVRYPPTREQVSNAEKLYKLINENKATLKPTGVKAFLKNLHETDITKKNGFWFKFAIGISLFTRLSIIVITGIWPDNLRFSINPYRRSCHQQHHT